MTSQPKHPTPWHSVAHFVRDANNRDICRIEPPELAAQVVAAINAQETPVTFEWRVPDQLETVELLTVELPTLETPVPDPLSVDDYSAASQGPSNRVAPSGGDFGALSPPIPGEAGEVTDEEPLPFEPPIEELERLGVHQSYRLGRAHEHAYVTAAEARATVAEGERDAMYSAGLRQAVEYQDRIASLSAELEGANTLIDRIAAEFEGEDAREMILSTMKILEERK
jgi:hypothetical protein